MNFLAHAYLSFQHPALLRGNLLGDFVKGEQRLAWPHGERMGMDLHRHIDRFTDEHRAFQLARALMRPAGIMGAGVFVDIIFDHMLAKHDAYFTETELQTFTQHVYAQLPLNHPATPPRALSLFQAMVNHNWLYQYRHIAGIEQSLQGMCSRYPRLGRGEEAITLFQRHYTRLNDYFEDLFPALEASCKIFITQHAPIQND